MGTLSLKDRITEGIKHIVYLIVLPVYLWSIGYKTLPDYIEAILDVECPNRRRVPGNGSESST